MPRELPGQAKRGYLTPATDIRYGQLITCAAGNKEYHRTENKGIRKLTEKIYGKWKRAQKKKSVDKGFPKSKVDIIFDLENVFGLNIKELYSHIFPREPQMPPGPFNFSQNMDWICREGKKYI